MSEAIAEARALLASGDLPGLLRYLRADGGALPLGDVAGLVAEAAGLAGFDDLAQAAAAVSGGGDGAALLEPHALWHYGYLCLERGVGYLAIRPLARALELLPGAAPVLGELVTALEQDGQHARAVALLEDHEPVMEWQHRFQYVYNALMAGQLDTTGLGIIHLARLRDGSQADHPPASSRRPRPASSGTAGPTRS